MLKIPDSTMCGQSRNAIEQVAAAVQLLPGEVRWLYSQPDRLLAEAYHSSVEYGRRTKLANAVFRQAGKIGAEHLLALFFGLGSVVSTYLRQFGFGRHRRSPKLLFVGNNGAKDPELRKAFEAEYGGAATYINEEKLSSFATVRRVGFASILREWLDVRKSIRRFADESVSRSDVPDDLVQFALKGHRYAYCAAWFRRHAEEIVDGAPVAFGSASQTVAHAAANVSLDTIHYPHGLMARSVVFPDFGIVRCTNRYEAAHIKRRLPRTEIRFVPEPFVPIATERTALIACGHFDDPDTENCRTFLEWARAKDLRIVVRKHPKGSPSGNEKWGRLRGIEFADPGNPFRECLETVRPQFLVAWYSTTALDAIARGVVSVTLNALAEENGVVPIEELSLVWPRDSRQLDRFVDDADAGREFAKRAHEKYAFARN